MYITIKNKNIVLPTLDINSLFRPDKCQTIEYVMKHYQAYSTRYMILNGNINSSSICPMSRWGDEGRTGSIDREE